MTGDPCLIFSFCLNVDLSGISVLPPLTWEVWLLGRTLRLLWRTLWLVRQTLWPGRFGSRTHWPTPDEMAWLNGEERSEPDWVSLKPPSHAGLEHHVIKHQRRFHTSSISIKPVSTRFLINSHPMPPAPTTRTRHAFTFPLRFSSSTPAMEDAMINTVPQKNSNSVDQSVDSRVTLMNCPWIQSYN